MKTSSHRERIGDYIMQVQLPGTLGTLLTKAHGRNHPLFYIRLLFLLSNDELRPPKSMNIIVLTWNLFFNPPSLRACQNRGQTRPFFSPHPEPLPQLPLQAPWSMFAPRKRSRYDQE